MSSSSSANEATTAVNGNAPPLRSNDAPLLKPNKSSLPLEMLTFFGQHFAPFFFILNICLFTYKKIRFYYPPRFLGWELTTVFLYGAIEYVRLLILSKGNKLCHLQPFVESLLLAAPIIVLHVYYLTLQTYVLRVDVVLNAVGLFLVGCQVIISLLAMLNIHFTSRQF